MDRKEIKALAKTKIKGNKWNIWWPLLLISFVQSFIEKIFGISMFDYSFDFENIENFANFKFNVGGTIISLIIAAIFGIVMIAYKKYVLNIVRGEKFEFNDIIECIKKRWSDILLVEVIMYVIVYLCSLVFVIPGIIMALAYAMASYLVVDTELGFRETLKKSREMMKGYKWNYFVFGLSFIGWILLTPLTLGILLIWLTPYMIIADALYYDKLKEITKK